MPMGRAPYLLLLLSAVIVGLLVGALLTRGYLDSRTGRHQVTLTGADISRHGGRSVSLVSGVVLYRQRCEGVCDDVMLEIWPRNQEYQVNVLGAEASCLLCEPVYADNSGRTKVTVSGQDSLSLTSAFGSKY